MHLNRLQGSGDVDSKVRESEADDKKQKPDVSTVNAICKSFIQKKILPKPLYESSVKRCYFHQKPVK